MLTKTNEITGRVTHTHTHTQVESRNSLGLVSIQKINTYNKEEIKVSLYKKYKLAFLR